MRCQIFLSLPLLALGGLLPVCFGDGPDESKFTRARQREYHGLNVQQEGTWKGPFFFMQLADTQYGMFSGNTDVAEEVELVVRTVAHINRLQPRFVIVCGDLTHAAPMSASFGQGHAQYDRQVRQFKHDFSKVSDAIPLVCVCGNHDIGNFPNAESIASYRKHFGDDYFGFWTGGVCNLVLNSTVIKESSRAEDVYSEQGHWFREQLAGARQSGAAHIFVFQHHPWFLETPDEPDQYFNLPLERRRTAIEVMQAAGVTAVFAGHYHRNSWGKAGDLEMITTGPVGRPLGKDPSGLRIVKVYADRIEHRYYGLDDVPAEIALVPDTEEPRELQQ